MKFSIITGKVDIKPTFSGYNRKIRELLKCCYFVCEILPTICILVFLHRFGRNTNDCDIDAIYAINS